MSSNILSENLRSIKTEEALYTAMFSLLKKLSFRKITIKEVCEEALISRATFYAHFADKYDLLRNWITELWPEEFKNIDTYEQLDKIVNCHLHEHIPLLKNLLCDADNETFSILFNFILSTINLTDELSNGDEHNLKNIVLSNFYAGGIISYILWQVRNKFPSNVPPMNKYLYDMIHELQDWQSK